MCIHKTIMGHAFICHKNEAIHIHEFFKNTFSLKSAKTKKKKTFSEKLPIHGISAGHFCQNH